MPLVLIYITLPNKKVLFREILLFEKPQKWKNYTINSNLYHFPFPKGEKITLTQFFCTIDSWFAFIWLLLSTPLTKTQEIYNALHRYTHSIFFWNVISINQTFVEMKIISSITNLL